MKRIRIILTSILVILVVFGWAKSGTSTISKVNSFSAHAEAAEGYIEEGLFQKAIIEYEEALKIKENPEIREQLIVAYAESYQSGFSTYKEYTNALTVACSAQEKNIEYWKTLMQLYIDSNYYSKAYDAYKKAIEVAGEDNFVEYKSLIIYDYKLTDKLYSDYKRSPGGYYSVRYNDAWGLIGPDGEWVYNIDYNYVSPASDDGSVVLVSESERYLIDGKGIVQKFLLDDYVSMMAYGDGIIPIAMSEDEYHFLDVESGQLSEKAYKRVSSFENGTAFVYEDGSWKRVSGDLQGIQEESYNDVKIYMNGSYLYDSIMVASTSDGYALYDENGKVKTEMACRDMDNYYGDYIAYQDENGLWGYINKKGRIVIEPQYKEAKSFSNGLAAVFDGKNWGYIDHKADLVIACQFTNADYFTISGMAFVSSDGATYQMLKLRF